jgi:very-short-patch-repair endonuclease
MKLYGVANSAQRSEVREKISENCAFKQDGFEEKRAKTMLERYGVVNAMDSQELRDKNKRTIQDRYGVDNVSQIDSVQAKKRETSLERYGNEQFLGSEIGREKIRQGMLDKYGVENAFQSEEIKDKIKETSIEKYGFDHHLKDRDRAIANAQKVLASKIKSGMVKLYNGKPVSEWLKESQYSDSAFRSLVNKHGLELALKMSPQISSLEQVVKEWLDSENIKYEQQFRVGNKIADFLLVDHKIILELDGLYWHSEHQLQDDSYHINKHFLYTSFDYHPLFFREDEVNNKFDIIKSIILNKIGRSIRVFARKCTIVEVSSEDSAKFFETNHLMGKGRGTTYGLKIGDDLVSCMIIRRTRDKNWDVSRFCHKLGHQVIGGFSKLIKHFLQKNEVDTLTTFIDRRYGDGSYLTDLGFEFIACSPSFRWTNTVDCLHRMKFPGNTGYDNGFVKIWDCGQARYDLHVQS